MMASTSRSTQSGGFPSITWLSAQRNNMLEGTSQTLMANVKEKGAFPPFPPHHELKILE